MGSGADAPDDIPLEVVQLSFGFFRQVTGVLYASCFVHRIKEFIIQTVVDSSILINILQRLKGYTSELIHLISYMLFEAANEPFVKRLLIWGRWRIRHKMRIQEDIIEQETVHIIEGQLSWVA